MLFRSSACDAGGYSWFNQVDFATGETVGGVGSGNVVSTRIVDGLTVGFGVIKDSSGEYKAIIRTTAYGDDPLCPDCKTKEVKVDVLPPAGRRISWREITQ